MAHGKSLSRKYLPQVIERKAWDPEWGPAQMGAEKRARRQRKIDQRRAAKAKRQR